jgi:hypothetical protein
MAMLQRYGIDITDTGSKLGNLQAILDATSAGMQIALAQTNTVLGEAERINIQWSEVKESFGKGLVGDAGASGLKGIGDALHEIATNGTAENLGRAASSIVEALPTLTQGFATVAEAVAWIAGNKPKAWAAGVGAYTQAYISGENDPMAAYRQGVSDYYSGIGGAGKGKTGASDFMGPVQPGTGGDASDATAGGIAAQETRINALMALYQKGGEYAKEALALEPKLLALWKAQASDIDKAAWAADQLTASMKAQEAAAKEAAAAEAKAYAEIQANYRSVLDAFTAGNTQFRAWMDNINGMVRTDAEAWRQESMSAGDAYVDMYKREMGLVEEMYRGVPEWAVQAWDDADKAGRQYLQSQYGVTAELEAAYEGAFQDISQTQQDAYAIWQSNAEAIKRIAEEAMGKVVAVADQWASAWWGADEAMRDMLESKWPGVEAYAKQHETTLERILREYNEANKSATVRLDTEKQITREMNQQKLTLYGSMPFTTDTERSIYATQAQRAAKAGTAQSLMESTQQQLAMLQFDIAAGKYRNQLPSISGGAQGQVSDLQALIELLQAAIQAFPQQGQSGAASGTEANPIVVKVQGGGMGTSSLEAIG